MKEKETGGTSMIPNYKRPSYKDYITDRFEEPLTDQDLDMIEYVTGLEQQLKDNIREGNKMEKRFKVVGNYWNSKDLKVISNGKDFFVLDGWNGERYFNCFKVSDEKGIEMLEDVKYEISPIYKQIENTEDYDIVNYEVS